MGLDGEVAIFQGKIEMLNLVIFKDWHLSAQFGSNLPYIFFLPCLSLLISVHLPLPLFTASPKAKVGVKAFFFWGW